MKNLTVLAAALAAGLMTFAANAQEGGFTRVAMLPIMTPITSGIAASQRQVALPEKGVSSSRGLTSEEMFHKAKAQAAALKPEERYKPIVEKYAFENGVPIELAHAVITVESNYKPYSLGRAGEVGLMQIKPATAKMMGYEGTTTGLFDPETNIKFGMKYLGKARKLGDGTTCGTILKYNAGHAAKRMNSTSRNYCEKVKQHLAGSNISASLTTEPKFHRGA
ncbi:MAG: transglycosylase SLT domain-containing protein [Rhizobiaceae bacterium]|nr:transglycosylase SLT domain-containing protein [Rhizobiaceae bacterium]